MTAIYPRIRRIRVTGHRNTRTLTCPYCRKVIRITLVNHLRRDHPAEWDMWSKEFLRLYNETNDLKRVMRAFTNSQGQPILSWTVIDAEVKRRVSKTGMAPRFLEKDSISRWQPSGDEYSGFTTTVWDVPRRGAWGVHQSTYRGNWAPQIPRAVIETYTSLGDTVLDPFVGGGTTLLEAFTLGRHGIGFDVSDLALEMTRSRLNELRVKGERDTLHGLPSVKVEVCRGDARKLPNIKPNSIELICTHPPYADALKYTHDEQADLSLIKDPTAFITELSIAGRRFFEVLRPGAYCAILIGDLRREGKLHALGFETLECFRIIGFELKELIIKTQNQDRSTEFFFRDPSIRFRIRHEYLLIFRKPHDGSKEKK